MRLMIPKVHSLSLDYNTDSPDIFNLVYFQAEITVMFVLDFRYSQPLLNNNFRFFQKPAKHHKIEDPRFDLVNNNKTKLASTYLQILCFVINKNIILWLFNTTQQFPCNERHHGFHEYSSKQPV